MKEKVVIFSKAALSIGGAVATNYLGGNDKWLELLVWLVVSDFFLGLILAIRKKQFSPLVAGAGFLTKILYFLVIALCVKIGTAIGKPDMVRNIAVIWFIVSEGSSVVENMCLLNVLPAEWSKIFTSAKNGFSVRLIDVIKQLVNEIENIEIGGKR